MNKKNIKNILRKVSVASLSIFALLIIYSSSGTANFLIYVFSLLLHEFSHLVSSSVFKVPIKSLDLLPFGARIKYKSMDISTFKKSVIFLSGPLSNFMFAIFIVIISYYIYIPSYDFFIFYNVLLGIINLIPTLPLDASRFILAVLENKFNKEDAFKIVLIISIIINSIVLLLGIYVLLLGSKNILLILLSIFLFNTLREEKDKFYYSLIKDNVIFNID